MAIDIYSTAFVNRVVDDLIPVPQVFLDLFFPEVLTHDTEEVYIDKAADKPRLTPFVHPLSEGKVVDSLGYTTKAVKPAYLKDLRVHDATKAIKRRAGEQLTGSLSLQQRQQANLVADLADQMRNFRRRLEVMAIEAVRDGQITVKGDGFDAVVSFGRDNSLTDTLTLTDRWNASLDVDIPGQLEDWSARIASFDGSVDAVIMDPKAWKLMQANNKVRALLDIRRGDTSSLVISPETAIRTGIQYKGMVGSFPIWVYTGSYIDPADGQTKKYMPDYTVVLAGRRLEGVRHFGAIMDVDVLQAREMYAQSWTEKNPSRRMLMLESAPLLVPYRPNSSMKITVADGPYVPPGE